MRTNLKEWNNSLILCIPKSFAIAAGLEARSEVELSLSAGELAITPVGKPAITLEQLLTQVTEDNLHSEICLGCSDSE